MGLKRTKRSLWIKLFVFFFLWVMCIRIGFGAIFFIAASFYLIFSNLRKERDSQLSAYSVFNEGYEQLEGTFNAREFESQLRGNLD